MTSSASLATLDVREILKAGGEPFEEIMRAVASLSPGQELRLLATFKPMPLFGVMSQRGYTHSEREIGGGDWEVIFSPAAASGAAETSRQAFLDVRDLPPPEPMQRALEAIEALKAGESLQVLTDREPTLLYHELERRSHSYTSESSSEGYRTTIRRGAAVGGRA
jgi:uncharacterized protein (DUF2249 family)